MSFPCGNHQNSRISSTQFPSTPLLRRPGNGHGQHMVVIDIPAIMPCAAVPVKMVPGAIDFLPAGVRAAFVLPQILPLSIFRPHVIPCSGPGRYSACRGHGHSSCKGCYEFCFHIHLQFSILVFSGTLFPHRQSHIPRPSGHFLCKRQQA